MLASVIFCTSLALKAQWPTPLNLNTATDPVTTNATKLPVTIPGTADHSWKVSITSISTGYVSAVRVAPVSGSWVTSPYTNADWISYPHTCDTNTPSSSWCDPGGAAQEEYYKVTINLTGGAGTYALNWTAYADNCIYKVYLNGTSPVNCHYTAPSGSSASYYGRTGFSTSVSGVINTGWVSGLNTLYIHVKSGTDPVGRTGNTGLLFYATGTYTPGSIWPPEPPVTCCLGNLCSDSENPLYDSYEIALDGHDFNFSSDEPDETSNKVNVGYDCGSAGPGKLNAFTSENTNSGQSISVYGKNAFNASGKGIGVMGEAGNNTSGALSVGVWGNAYGATDNIGGNFFATARTGDGGGGGTRWNVGVSGIALPGGTSSAPYSYQASWPSANIGVYGAGDPTNSRAGMPGSNWAGWFDGDVFINGTGYYPGFSPIASDRKFKKEITPINNASDIISKLKPSNYFLNTDNEYGFRFSKSKQYGFISQEVETVMPELVEDVHKPAMLDAKGNIVKKEVDYKALNYIGFIALLTKGMQEQQAQISQQQQQINELKSLVQALAGNTAGNAAGKTTSVPVNLSDKNTIVLNQNVPNPFAESTVISYNIPSDFTKAQVIFTSTEGIIIKTVDITAKGTGSLTVFANDLTHGIYTYSLVIDGKTIDTKKMIKE